MSYESDPIASKLNELVNSRELYFDLAGFNELNPAEQALIGTWELANEVYNGGFMQYFHNSSHEHARPMIAVLRSVDAQEAADILENAVALAGPGTPLGDEPNYLAAIKSISEGIRSRLSELERKWHAESDNLHLQFFRYLSKHRDKIEAPAEFWTEETLQ